ncbi:hypothetical protein V6259_12515 [Marinomonas sp. TI.3.20]|uniref:hypothetical protein n=1 Tax=Marinomonas sp. TI.3.20 TaxID=3121296 RepID=UPI00311FDCB3
MKQYIKNVIDMKTVALTLLVSSITAAAQAETVIKFSSSDKYSVMDQKLDAGPYLNKFDLRGKNQPRIDHLNALAGGGSMEISGGHPSADLFSSWILDDRITLKENLESWVDIHNSQSAEKVKLIWPKDAGPGVFHYGYSFNGTIFEAATRLGLAAKESHWPITIRINTLMNTITVEQKG